MFTKAQQLQSVVSQKSFEDRKLDYEKHLAHTRIDNISLKDSIFSS